MEPDAVSETVNEPKPAAPAAVPTRMQRRENAVRDALRTLIRDHFTQSFGVEGAPQEALHVSLDLAVHPGEGWAVAFDTPLEEQIAAQLQEAEAGRGLYREGRVFCFRCRSSACAHSEPPSPLAVFRGYAPTGLPEWCELVQSLVEAKDERIDRLFDDAPLILALAHSGHALRAQQLGQFGRSSKTYAILGQVVAGYFTHPAGGRRRAPGPERFALTAQAVETRGTRGEFLLKLNVIAGGWTPSAWQELLAEDDASSLAHVLHQAGRALEDIQSRMAGAGARAGPKRIKELMTEVPRALVRLARGLEQVSRRGQRRTRHAERHVRGERPVHKAVEDARDAPMDALYFDEKRGTWIVCGKQGRVHAFNAEGKHVTSFVLPAGGPEFRVRTQRWRKLQAAEVETFRALIAS